MALQTRRIGLVLALAGLVMGLWGFSHQWTRARAPDSFSYEDQAYPIFLAPAPDGSSLPAHPDSAGKPARKADRGSAAKEIAAVGSTQWIKVGSPDQLRFEIQSYARDQILLLMTAPSTSGNISSPPDGGTEQVSRIRLPRQLSAVEGVVTLASGLFFFLILTLVLAPRLSRGPVSDFYGAVLLFGLAVLVGGIHAPRAGGRIDAVFPAVWIISTGVLPVLFVKIGLTFPRRTRLSGRAPWLVPAVSILAAALVLWQLGAFLLYFDHPGPDTWSRVGPARWAAQGFLIVGVLSGCITLYAGYRNLDLTRERNQAKWLLWGFSIGVAPYVFLRTFLRLVGLESPLGAAVDRILEMAIPLAFGFAVARYQFLDIDIIIRRSLLYTVLASVLAGFYLAVAGLAGGLLGDRFPSSSRYVPPAAAVIAVSLFHPTRRLLGLWIDRTFFKIRHGYTQAMDDLRRNLPRAGGQEEVAELLVRLLAGGLGAKAVTVLICGAQGIVTRGHPAGWLGEPRDALIPVERSSDLKMLAAPESTSLPEEETSAFPSGLAEQGVRIALPLPGDDGTAGWVLLGEKETERRYVEEDIRLLREAASEAGAVLERMRLLQRAAQEEAARRRLAELNEMKSVFFSRVAHDLKTPLTSISWSAQNLLDGVLGGREAEQRAYLLSIRESADHLARVVNNLLEVSRLEAGVPSAGREPVDLYNTIQKGAQSVEPECRRRGIRVDLLCPDPIPPVSANREKLMEIAVNLLENAVRFSPDGQIVEVAFHESTGWGEFTVRDRGPGVRPEDLERIFLRFEQGRSSPYVSHRGFGLGLFVSRSLAEGFGGSLKVCNHPGGGACFTCRLPVWRPESEERKCEPAC